MKNEPFHDVNYTNSRNKFVLTSLGDKKPGEPCDDSVDCRPGSFCCDGSKYNLPYNVCGTKEAIALGQCKMISMEQRLDYTAYEY